MYWKLSDFLKEAIKITRKEIDPGSLPTTRRFRKELFKKGKKETIRYVPYRSPNWWQIGRDKGLEKLSILQTYKAAIKVCTEHSQIKLRDGKQSFAFRCGQHFNAKEIPLIFLKELINYEDDLKFNKNSLDKIFELFLEYISSQKKSDARLVIPFDNLLIQKKEIELEPGLRIKRLNTKERLDLINQGTILDFFYGTTFKPWFTCILEHDIPFDWFWTDKRQDSSKCKTYEQYRFFRGMVNLELVIFRAILNKPISSPTYVIDYRGWQSVSFTGGSLNELPWLRITPYDKVALSGKEISKYIHYRKRFLNIKHDNYKEWQRIFIAMRRLAFSMDRPYAGDRLIDCISGLEGLLVEGKNEVRHKLSERVALLLRNSQEEKLALLEEMKKLYDLRSDIVHGEAVFDDLDLFDLKIQAGQKISKKESNDFNRIYNQRTTGELLNKAILRCIDRQSTKFDWEPSIMSARYDP